MNYIDEIFLRADIQQLRMFLLYGVDGDPDPRPYQERLDSAQKPMTARFQQEYPDMEKYEEMTGLVYNYGLYGDRPAGGRAVVRTGRPKSENGV